ncbi:MAG: NAD-glutamate dehydrogenase domain-containing protein, partial [Planctomycetota bacterium]
AEVQECYRIMMRAMLDVTDNLEGDAIVPPPDIRIHDDNDPYLVVAADKGTATFSDIANGISMDHGFWLDDAFASGGSAGYDHKVMGITARGAWESVKRHFREAGKDTQTEDFTVVGVGDMSGDVFGNGMLLSEHIRLIAAFNHLHIFVDPDPDIAKSFAERSRLFKLPRSSWTDYDASTISEGGGVFERKAKSIPINAQLKAAFGIDADRLTPSELIQAILRADVELLWFGGIGTYVKAEAESHADVGDHANNAVRVGAKELRARVIGEGANLGMTQRARVEFGRTGGRLNTDAIDNSAGVDCSDHEVNIKILLREAEKAGTITRPERDVLLGEMTEEVSVLVLRDNYLQTQAITVTHQLGGHLLDRIARYMRTLERQNRLSRRLEDLPDDEELKDRFKEGLGFTRPELSVLLAYAKIELYDELLNSDIPDDPYMQGDLKRYFPEPLRERFPELIEKHRLRREIVATVLTNSIINRVGLAFIHEVKEVSGMPAPDIARAYVVSRETLGIRQLWRSIEALDNQVPATLQAVMLAEGGRLLQRSTAWCLREGGFGIDIGKTIDAYESGVRELSEGIVDVLSQANRKLVEETEAIYGAQGVPEDVARHVAILPVLFSAWDIERLARRIQLPVLEVARTYFGIGARFGFDWLRRAAESLPADTAWNKQAVVAIVDDLFAAQSDLTQRILDVRPDGATSEEAIAAWADGRRPIIARTEQLLAELQSTPAHDFAMLAVANRQLKSLGV